ncbi:Hypothetical predicted protein, partial [Paramuricea clavata]
EEMIYDKNAKPSLSTCLHAPLAGNWTGATTYTVMMYVHDEGCILYNYYRPKIVINTKTNHNIDLEISPQEKLKLLLENIHTMAGRSQCWVWWIIQYRMLGLVNNPILVSINDLAHHTNLAHAPERCLSAYRASDKALADEIRSVNEREQPSKFLLLIGTSGLPMCILTSLINLKENETLGMNSLSIHYSIKSGPPYSFNHPATVNMFITEFADFLESVVMTIEPLLIAGDFNIHVNKQLDKDCGSFLDLLSSMGLQQHINFPTHTSGNTLDLLVTRTLDSDIIKEIQPDIYFSDHCSILFSINISKPRLSRKKVTFRKTKAINTTTFVADLSATKLCQHPPSELDKLVDCYNTTLTDLLDHHAPLKTKTVTVRPQVPWYSEEVRVAKRERRRAERKWRSSGTAADFESFKRKKNRVTHLLRVAKSEFLTDFIDQNADNQGKLFRAIYDHLVQSGLYPLLQSAYRQYHSTETALLKVANDILMNMNSQRVTLLVLLDLSAAFDTVDHEILLSRLSSSFGIRGKALEWFSSYLSGRSQRIVFDGVTSDSCDLFEIVQAHLPDAHGFADDTQLYLSFNPNNPAHQTEAVSAMEGCISDLRKWIQQILKVNPCTIRVGNTEIKPVSEARNLGSWFDSNLSMSTHISKSCGATFCWLHKIKRISKFLAKDQLEMILHAFVTSRIDYCNGLLYGLPDCDIVKLQNYTGCQVYWAAQVAQALFSFMLLPTINNAK